MSITYNRSWAHDSVKLLLFILIIYIICRYRARKYTQLCNRHFAKLRFIIVHCLKECEANIFYLRLFLKRHLKFLC